MAIFKISESELKACMDKKERILKENRYIKEMTEELTNVEDTKLSLLGDKINKVYELINSVKEQGSSSMNPQYAERVCALCNICADESLDVFSEISISDIEEITALRAFLSQLGNILYEVSILCNNYETSRSSFSKNAYNSDEHSHSNNISGKINEMEKKIADLSKFIQNIENSFKKINKEITMKRHSMRSSK